MWDIVKEILNRNGRAGSGVSFDGMFYFFQKGRDYLRCEIRARNDGSYDLLIEEPDAVERVEHFPTPQTAHRRWEELQKRFTGDGWFGPYGRE